MAPVGRAQLLPASSRRGVMRTADPCLGEAGVPRRGWPGHGHVRFRAGGWLGAEAAPGPEPCLPKPPAAAAPGLPWGADGEGLDCQTWGLSPLDKCLH